MAPAMDVLTDVREIDDLLIRYATALDTRDWALLATCFVPDSIATFGTFGEFRTVEAIVEALRKWLEPLDATQHLIANVAAEIDGDSARSRCYVVAQHVRNGQQFTLGGTYVDVHRRTPDGWLIVSRRLDVTWTQGDPAVVIR